MEQQSNALALVRLELGSSVQTLDAEAVRDWLDSPAITARVYPDVAGEIVRWIESGNWDEGASLARSLWAAS